MNACRPCHYSDHGSLENARPVSNVPLAKTSKEEKTAIECKFVIAVLYWPLKKRGRDELILHWANEFD